MGSLATTGRIPVVGPSTRLVLGAVLALIGGVMPFVAPAAAAPAVTVSCGEVITVDTKLANDLVDCPRHGIMIGAPNITLDLNGHRIDGDGVPFEPCPADEPCDVGIANSGLRDGTAVNGEGFPGVTIKNGSVREFPEVGVYITNTRKNIVRAVATSTSPFHSDGVHLRGCTHCRVMDSSASGYSVGMVIERSTDVQVDNVHIQGNTFAGLLVALSEHVEIIRSTISDTFEGDGIALIDDSDDNVVRHNVVSGSFGGIVLVEGSDGNLVRGNSVHDNMFAGVAVVGSDRNVIDRNKIMRNGDGSEGGIRVLSSEAAPSNGTVLSRNSLGANVGDGIIVDAGQGETVVDGNTAHQNTDDGIDIQSTDATVRQNTANRNADLGIEVAAGVTDGGGNKASGNANPLQCVNITCA